MGAPKEWGWNNSFRVVGRLELGINLNLNADWFLAGQPDESYLRTIPCHKMMWIETTLLSYCDKKTSYEMQWIAGRLTPQHSSLREPEFSSQFPGSCGRNNKYPLFRKSISDTRSNALALNFWKNWPCGSLDKKTNGQCNGHLLLIQIYGRQIWQFLISTLFKSWGHNIKS